MTLFFFFVPWNLERIAKAQGSIKLQPKCSLWFVTSKSIKCSHNVLSAQTSLAPAPGPGVCFICWKATFSNCLQPSPPQRCWVWSITMNGHFEEGMALYLNKACDDLYPLQRRGLGFWKEYHVHWGSLRKRQCLPISVDADRIETGQQGCWPGQRLVRRLCF